MTHQYLRGLERYIIRDTSLCQLHTHIAPATYTDSNVLLFDSYMLSSKEYIYSSNIYSGDQEKYEDDILLIFCLPPTNNKVNIIHA